MGFLEEISDTPTTPPEHAFTIAGARIASGLSDATTRRKVYDAVAAGRLESGKFLVDAHHTQYFWEAKDAKVRKR